jgi:phospholipase/lecithinase/hemolysin
MRHRGWRALVRSVALAGTAVAAAAGLGLEARAEERFNRLFIFGDSYADLTLANPLATGQIGVSLWNVYPVSLANSLQIPTSIDFAVGGATASPGGSPALPPFWNLPQQVDALLDAGITFGPRDLVTLNIGGNDIRAILQSSPSGNKALGYPEALIDPLNAKDFANVTAGFVAAEIDRLVKAGAHDFVLGGFSTFSRLPELQAILGKLPPAIAEIVAASADNYADAYFKGLQLALLPYAQAGTRFFLFDLARLADAVSQDPAKYGFIGFVCPPNAVNPGVCGATPGNPGNMNAMQRQYYFGPDGLHLTDAGFDLVGKYMANIVQAPDTIAVQPGVVTSTMGGFVQGVLGRVDGAALARESGGAKGKGPIAAYAMGTILGGDTGGAYVGYDYFSRSGTIGVELSINRNLILGVAGNYATTDADLSTGAGIKVDAIQGAAYLSYATRSLFAEVLVGYASSDVYLDRPGVIDWVHSKTGASSVAAATRGGYLFDVGGGLRAGPIAGVTYIHSKVDGYTEKGDPLLTYSVSAQTLDSITTSLGVRLLAPFKLGGTTVAPYLDIMLEHQFGDHTRTLTASLTQASVLPILTSVIPLLGCWSVAQRGAAKGGSGIGP